MRLEQTDDSATNISQLTGHATLMEKNDSISKLLEMATVARAKNLARKGKLKQAELLLVPLSNKQEPAPDILDLLARVYAQQGKVPEARCIWLRLLQADSSDRHILQALLDLTFLEYMSPVQLSFMRFFPWLMIIVLTGLIAYLLTLCVQHGL